MRDANANPLCNLAARQNASRWLHRVFVSFIGFLIVLCTADFGHSDDSLASVAEDLSRRIQRVDDSAIEQSARETIQKHVRQLPIILQRAKSQSIPESAEIDLERLAHGATMTAEELQVRAEMLDRLAILLDDDPAAISLSNHYRNDSRLIRFAESDFETIQSRCRRAAELLSNDGLRDDLAIREELAETLAWLEERGIAPAWVHQVRQRYFHANIACQVDGRVLLSRLQRSRPVQRPVREMILGAHVTGTSQGMATISPSLLPSDQTISLLLTLETQLNTQSVGTKSRATVYSVGQTQLIGNKRIDLDRKNITTSYGEVTGFTDSRIVDFDWDLFIGRQLALREAQRSKPAADRIAAQRAARRASRDFNSQVDSRLPSVRRRFRERFVLPLSDPKIAGGRWQVRSTQQSVQLAAVLASPNQPGAERRFQGFPTPQGNYLMLHQSAVNNLVASRWSGTQINEQQWLERLRSIPGLDTSSLEVVDPDRTWKLRFDEERPVAAKFDQGRIKIILRILEFVVGDDAYPGLEIEVDYVLDSDKVNWKIRRDGRLRLSSLDDQDGPSGVRSQVFRSLVRKRFEPIFSQSVDIRTMVDGFPALTWLVDAGLKIDQIEANNGWLSVSGN